MQKRHVLIMTINNMHQDYVNCMHAIDDIVGSKTDFLSTINCKFYSSIYSRVIVNKLDEPLNQNSEENTYLNPEKFPEEANDTLKECHIHIRILYNNSNINEYMLNLHYIPLILYKYRNLVENRRLSFFLVPRTSNTYPYADKDGNTDTEIYNLASVRLRAFIGDENHGVIYGVSSKVTDSQTNIVKALDFKKIFKENDCLPLIFLKDIENDGEDDLVKKYFSHELDSITTVNKNQLDLFYLFFYNGIIGKYINDFIKSPFKNARFGYSNDPNPILAIVDYMFEVSANNLRNKLGNRFNSVFEIGKGFDGLRPVEMSIFTFSIFSFIFPTDNSIDSSDFETTVHNYTTLATQISDAINQIAQNSLQHSKYKICCISILKEKDREKDFLRIIISDIGDKTINNTFFEELKKEQNTIDQINDLVNIKFENVKSSNDAILNSTHKIELKNLFNDFDENDIESVALWNTFRQNDSSAHIGLGLFSHIMRKCKAGFSVVSSVDYSCTSENIYCQNWQSNNDWTSIPGTEYNISIPLDAHLSYDTFSLSQIQSCKYQENYESYTDFFGYSIIALRVPHTNNKDDANNPRRMLYNQLRTILKQPSLDKFTQQLAMTKVWLDVLNENQIGNNQISCLDFSQMGFNETYLPNSGIHREVTVKGFINALGIYTQSNKGKIYLAVINVPNYMMTAFSEVTISLAIKQFPNNLQLYIAEKRDGDKRASSFHLIGSTYGEAIQNAISFSISDGTESYDISAYDSVSSICKPFKHLMNHNSSNSDKVVPFSLFLTKDGVNYFFEDIKHACERELSNGNGYMINNTHTRLGNKVHSDTFYEVSYLFYRTIVANRVAFEIIKNIMKCSNINILSDNILFYGYASYSQAILTSLTNIVNIYRKKNNIDKDVNYAVYQYNIQAEIKEEVQFYRLNNVASGEEIKVVQIVPISSTMTTFGKMWRKFTTQKNINGNYRLSQNYTVVWVRDNVKDPRKELKTTNGITYTTLESKYYTPNPNNVITAKIECLKKYGCSNISYIFSLRSTWESPEKCSCCYPVDVKDEKPLVETDPTSTVPSQQLYLTVKHHVYSHINNTNDAENLSRIMMLNGSVLYGHYIRGKNHFQHYIDTKKYFSKVESNVKMWLLELSKNDHSNDLNAPCQRIIFSPEHNTNVGFSQYVNSFYFNGTAEIISINEDKEFRTNFICEHSSLRNTIERLFLIFGSSNVPVKFYFVDDTIITGSTLFKANSLLQSLIPGQYLSLFPRIVFEKCFFLVDRLSDDSKLSMVQPLGNFISFCHVNVSNIRTHGDSCVGCNILKRSEKYIKSSTTQFAAKYWSQQACDLQPKLFGKIPDIVKERDFIILVLSHIVKTFFSTNKTRTQNEFNNIITVLFAHITLEENNIKTNDSELYSQYTSYWKFLEQYHVFFEKYNNKKQLCECLIKIISRPFFTYNFTLKSATLNYLISLAEYMLDPPSFTNNADQLRLDSIKAVCALYSSNQEKTRFIDSNIFRALADLHSTYLIRKSTMRKVIKFASAINAQENFWNQYAIDIQVIIDGSADESRCLWLENLLITGKESFTDFNSNSNEKSENFLSSSLLKEMGSDVSETTKRYFERFIQHIFIGNRRILFDSAVKSSSEDADQMINSDGEQLFSNRLNMFISLDSFLLCKEKIQKCNILYSFFNNSSKNDADTGKTSDENGAIKKRYDELITNIKKHITKKYNFATFDNSAIIDYVRIAILTSTETTPDKLRICDLDVISNTIDGDRNADTANSKYIIKQRIVNAVTNNCDLIDIGYYICNFSSDLDDNKVYIEAQENENYNSEYHRDPYIIFRFDISQEMAEADSEMKHINPVYMYISAIHPERNVRKYLPMLIAREVLMNKYQLNKYFVADFTTDVMQKYAHSIGTEAVLKTDKEISHRPLHKDFNSLKTIFELSDSSNSGAINKEKMLEWFTARNYSDTMTARLHNRVLRNLNAGLPEVIADISTRKNVKLYVDVNSCDGNSFPIKKLGDILPSNTDCIYKLFSEVITFKGITDRKGSEMINVKPACVTYKNTSFTFNRDYVKNIIYQICLDALKYSRAAGISNDSDGEDFVKSIENLYRAKQVRDIKKTHSSDPRIKDMLSTYNDAICTIKFSIEPCNDDDLPFDWLVIENDIETYVDPVSVMEKIKKKLSDPLDFSDGHMSLLAHSEFLSKMYNSDIKGKINKEMYTISKKTFTTKLPIVAKGGLK